MGTLRAAPATQTKASSGKLYKSVFSKLTIAAGLLAAFASPEHISEIFLESLSAAYTDVTVFVAATMIPIHFLGHKLNLGKFEPILENKYYRIPLAALLGASPGYWLVCLGAIHRQKYKGGAGISALPINMTQRVVQRPYKTPSFIQSSRAAFALPSQFNI